MIIPKNYARISPIDGRFTSIDPLCEKYPGISPYVHCNNNPLSIIDPTGMDIWELNNKGEIISRIEDKTEDAFYMVEKNKKGNYERIYTLDNNGEKNINIFPLIMEQLKIKMSYLGKMVYIVCFKFAEMTKYPII